MAQPTPNRRLKRWRLRAGLTQTKLAELTGVSVAMISYLEAGLRAPGASLSPRLAAALNVDVDDVIDSIPEPPARESTATSAVAS